MEWWNGILEWNTGILEWNTGILEWNTGILEWNSYMRRTAWFFHVFDVCLFSSCLGGLINGESARVEHAAALDMESRARGSADVPIVIDSDESCSQSSPVKIVPGQKFR